MANFNQRFYQFKHWAKEKITGKPITDVFDWDIYTQHYKGELAELQSKFTLVLHPGDYEFQGNKLLKKKSVKPLHVNHQLLYETILQLHPQSVLEIGCGGGDMLANLKTLSPDLRVYGEDISDHQLDLLNKRHPELQTNVKINNIVDGMLKDWPPIDVVFTQAVIMHIKTAENHKQALQNVFNQAQQYVVLMENWFDHDFVKDIHELHRAKKIHWDTLNLYSRPYPGTDKAYLLIASKKVLANYTPLLNDEQLRKV